MILFPDLLLNDLSCDVHGKSADLILGFVDGFFLFLCDICFRTGPDSCSLLLCIPDGLICLGLCLLLRILQNDGCLAPCLGKTALILCFQAVCLFPRCPCLRQFLF